MLLCLDVGNSHVFGGLFDQNDTLLLQFRYASRLATSDEIGVFLRSVLRENGFDNTEVRAVALCSVVPTLDYSLRAACVKYLKLEPFMLHMGAITGLQFQYHNPLEIGADRIANAIAAVSFYPNQNKIIIDFGTTITFCAISAKNVYLGGVIVPGMQLSRDALCEKTAKLPSVEIVRPQTCLGRTTAESIQSGLYFAAIGSIREIVKHLKQEVFLDEKVCIIGTGGFASLFEGEALYDVNAPHLVLHGLRLALACNRM